MLVIHPSSRCDVCLDAYTWETPAQTPHAIPCGHIFCKTCLRAVIPSNCPLCRKAFLADRAKKLHVDRPENLEEERDLDLLQRLALAWDTPENHLVELTDEVESWLRTRRDDTSAPLRKAREALGKYQKLKEKREQDHKKIKTLEQTLRHREQSAAYEKDTTKAVENSLLAEVENLITYVEKYESEVAGLRSELARYQHTSNPLPAPPEPVPLDRFPPFARAAAWSSSVSNSNETRFQAPDGTEQDVLSSADPYVNGYPAYFVGNSVSPDAAAPAELGASEREASEAREARERGARQLRKGKKPLYNFYRYPTAQDGTDINNDRKRNGIIPGASPNQRVIPPRTVMNGELRMGGVNMWTPYVGNNGGLSSRLDNGMGETNPIDLGPNEVVDPSAPATAYVSGYTTGYGYGFQYAHNYTPSVGAVHQPSDPDQARAREQGLGNMGSLAAALPDNQDQGIGSLGLLGVPPPPMTELLPEQERGLGSSGLSTAAAAPPFDFLANSRQRSRASDSSRAHRPATTRRSTDRNMTDSASAGPSSGPVRRRRRRRSTQNVNMEAGAVGAAGDEESVRESITERNSVSSWGTIAGARNTHDSTGSMSELGLISFPPRASTWAGTITDTPLMAVPGAFLSSENRVDNVDANENDVDTPRMANRTALHLTEIGPVSRLLGIDPRQSNMQIGATDENRPRHRRLSSYPVSSTQQSVPSPGPSSTQTNIAVEERPLYQPFPSAQEVPTQSQHRGRLPVQHARRNRGHDIPLRFSSSVEISGRAPSSPTDIITNQGYLTEPPLPLTPNFGNALGLDLSQSPDQSGPQITAPTPITSTRTFLRMHNYDTSR